VNELLTVFPVIGKNLFFLMAFDGMPALPQNGVGSPFWARDLTDRREETTLCNNENDGKNETND